MYHHYLARTQSPADRKARKETYGYELTVNDKVQSEADRKAGRPTVKQIKYADLLADDHCVKVNWSKVTTTRNAGTLITALRGTDLDGWIKSGVLTDTRSAEEIEWEASYNAEVAERQVSKPKHLGDFSWLKK